MRVANSPFNNIKCYKYIELKQSHKANACKINKIFTFKHFITFLTDKMSGTDVH